MGEWALHLGTKQRESTQVDNDLILKCSERRKEKYIRGKGEREKMPSFFCIPRSIEHQSFLHLNYYLGRGEILVFYGRVCNYSEEFAHRWRFQETSSNRNSYGDALLVVWVHFALTERALNEGY